MNQERWQRIEALFHEARNLETGERSRFLETACEGDEALRREVEILLKADADTTDGGIQQAIGAAASAAFAPALPDAWVGRRVGHWKITALVGEGGMGTVYRGVRDSGDFDQDVAIKVMRLSVATGHGLLRFRRERRILAMLEHPHIARLLDGGEIAGPDRVQTPYIVMEFVSGEPITGYCLKRRLGIREKLTLFLQVLEAVEYAHQKLVLHRDVKPDNILVTPGGAVKLLDFGIAKLREEEPGGELQETLSSLVAMTPAYASPEQIRGEPLTAATDIYSLGVLLYELLAGRRPYTLPSRDVLALVRAITDTTPAALGLGTDLDTVVAKAIHKDLSRRYASVEQFASDIRRYLTGYPVRARKDTIGYRAGKFIRRHVALVALGALALFSLTGGLFFSVREARRADRRFQEVRVLARRMLFDFDEKIAKVPGNTEARQMLVETATEYLDKLSRDAGGDRDLLEELAGAYKKVGEIQGSASGPNVGRSDAALVSFRKALAISEVLARDGSDAKNLERIASVHLRVSTIEEGRGSRAVALDHVRRGEAAAEELLRVNPDGTDSLYMLMRAAVRRGDLQRSAGNLADALKAYSRAEVLIAPWFRKEPANARANHAMSLVLGRLTSLKVEMGDLEGALVGAEADLENVSRRAPDTDSLSQARRNQMIAHYSVGRVLGAGPEPSLMRYEEAEAHLRAALSIAETLAAEDPGDARAHTDLIQSLCNLAGQHVLQHPAEGLRLYTQASELAAALRARDPDRVLARMLEADALEGRIESMAALGRLDEAMELLPRLAAARETVERGDPKDVGARSDRLRASIIAGGLHEERGDLEGARAILIAALPEISKAVNESPQRVPARVLKQRLLTTLGRVEARLALSLAEPERSAMRAQAREHLEEVVSEWEDWKRRGLATAWTSARLEETRKLARVLGLL